MSKALYREKFEYSINGEVITNYGDYRYGTPLVIQSEYTEDFSEACRNIACLTPIYSANDFDLIMNHKGNITAIAFEEFIIDREHFKSYSAIESYELVRLNEVTFDELQKSLPLDEFIDFCRDYKIFQPKTVRRFREGAVKR